MKKTLTILSLVMISVLMFSVIASADLIETKPAKDDNNNFGSQDNEALGIDYTGEGLTLDQLFSGDGLQYEYTILDGGAYNGASPAMATIDLEDGRHIALFPGWGDRTGTHDLQFSNTVATATADSGNVPVDFVIHDASWSKSWGSQGEYGNWNYLKASGSGSSGVLPLTGSEIVTRVGIQHQAANTGAEDQIDSIVVSGETFERDTIAPEITEIDHVPENPSCGTPIGVCATVTDFSNIERVALTWNNGQDSGTLAMTTTGEDRYCRTPLDLNFNAANEINVDYSITAKDVKGNSHTTGDFSFTFDCENPVAEFNCDVTGGDESLTTICESTSDDNMDDDLEHSWTITGGEPSTSTEDSVEIDYENDGVYTVELIVTDDAGNTAIAEETITVNDIGPSASFTEDVHTLNEGETVTFTDTSTSHDDIVSWSWDFGDSGTSTQQNPTHTYLDDGEYTVTLTVSDADGDEDTATSTKTVNNLAPNPNAGEYECNEGETIPLTATATDVAADLPLTFEWNLDGDNIYEETGESVDYTCGSSYTIAVSVKVTDKDGSSGYDNAEITISNIPPTAEILNAPYSGVVAEPITLTGNAIDVVDTVFTYKWDCDYDGTTFAQDNTDGVCTYNAKGTHTVALIANDGDDDSAIVTTEVTVYAYGIDLNTGWNFISIPLVPEDTNINAVLSEEISENAEVIWSYQEGEWEYNEPLSSGKWSTSSSKIKEIIPGYGYYLKMKNESVIHHNGEKMYGNSDNNADWAVPKPPVVTLTPGWNSIGHYGILNILKPLALTTLDGNYATLIDKDGNPITTLEPTEGYWLFLTGITPLDYAPSSASYSF